MKFQDVFKKLRQDKELTQAELAKKLGLSRSTIGMYENGLREPDFETEEKIADFFNVSLDYLRNGNDHAANIFSNDLLSVGPEYFILRTALKSEEEVSLILNYRVADSGTQAAVRKLLDISHDTLLPIAAHADDDATPEELEADVNILKNHVGVDVSGTDTVRRTD